VPAGGGEGIGGGGVAGRGPCGGRMGVVFRNTFHCVMSFCTETAKVKRWVVRTSCRGGE
jgi:hypothetical protein